MSHRKYTTKAVITNGELTSFKRATAMPAGKEITRTINTPWIVLRNFGQSQIGAMFALLLVTILAYLPSLSGEFLWDDEGHITKPELRSLEGLKRIWSDPHATQQYYPLLHSAFWIEHRLWDKNPFGYRLVNILLHVTSAGFLATLLRRLAVPGAWLAAFIFALHPVSVESVAWITEQKNTLSLVFYLSAALAYLRFHSSRHLAHYGLASVLFIAAVLTKTVTVTLPAALLVLIAWRSGRLNFRKDFVPLSMWLVIGLCAGFFTVWVERTLIGAQGSDFSLSPLERCILASRAVWFYFGKLIWPLELVFIYPRWTIDVSNSSQYIGMVTMPVVLVALIWWKRHFGVPLVCFILFVGTLFPALGFIDVYPFLYSFVADHFQYHASLSIIAGMTALLTLSCSKFSKIVRTTGAVALLFALGSLTFSQSFNYRSNTTLFTATLEKNPACWMAHTNLGVLLMEKNDAEAALLHFEAAVLLRPDPEERNNLGNALTQLGRAPEAVAHLKYAINARPGFVDAYNNLGVALMAMLRPSEAVATFREALKHDPTHATTLFNLGLSLAHTGDTTAAITHFASTVLVSPNHANAHLHWGVCLTLQGDLLGAITHYEKAIKLAPSSSECRFLYGRALESFGQTNQAIKLYLEALAIDPTLSEVRLDLARAYQAANLNSGPP